LRVPRLAAHDLDGRLVVVEGLSRAGKSTLLDRLEGTAAAAGWSVVRVGWNSDPVVSPAITTLKREARLSPWVFSLLHLADYRATYDGTVLPALRAGRLVLSDRYVYTSWVRDGVRRVPDDALVPALEAFVRPDAAVFLDTRLETVLERFDSGEKPYGRYGLGLDLEPAMSSEREAFAHYQTLQRTRYLALAAAGLLATVRSAEEAQAVVAPVLARP
jgi:dTMP kinase